MNPSRADKSVPNVDPENLVPDGIDRRAFLMRHAAIGAAAVMTGANWPEEARAQQAATEASAQRAAMAAAKDGVGLKMSAALSRSRGRQEFAGRRHDSGGRITGWARTFELPHDRSDAHHLRLL